MSVTLRKLVLVLACALAAACSDDGTGPSAGAVEGVYTLQSINGEPLPVTLIEFIGLYRLQQTGGTMSLNANKTFVERADLRETNTDGNASVTKDTTIMLNGVWEVDQDSVILLTTQQDGSVLFGTVSNGRLTLHFEPQSAPELFTYFYRK